jgi:hypothetical protein
VFRYTCTIVIIKSVVKKSKQNNITIPKFCAKMSRYLSHKYSDHDDDQTATVKQGEPGPAIERTPTPTDDFGAEELAYFRTLPEHTLQALYPDGIRPPKYLGPATPYDKYAQFHGAILHLAAGLSLKQVIKKGDFDITEGEFVQHLAKFCAKSLDYTEEDFACVSDQFYGSDVDALDPDQLVNDGDAECGAPSDAAKEEDPVAKEAK